MSRKKIILIMGKIHDSSEALKQIKGRIRNKNISYNEIACVRVHLKMKEKIKIKNFKG